MIKTLYRYKLLLILITLPIGSSAEELQQLSFYDYTGNGLFYVTFEYENSVNTHRNIYDPDGFLSRRTTLVYNGAIPLSHTYYEGSGPLRSYSNYSYNGNNTSLSLFNEFDKLLFQTSYDNTSANHSYKLSTGAKFDYEHAADGISKINIYDANDSLTHYVIAHYTLVGMAIQKKITNKNKIHTLKKLNNNTVEITFDLTKRQTVIAEVYDIKGAWISNLLNKPFPRGKNNVTLSTNNLSQISFSLYILKFSLGDLSNTYKVKLKN